LSSVLLVSAAGEMMGYFSGPGRSVQKLTRLEFQRPLHLSKRDQESLNEG
jgi:hypothetical protein